MALNIMWLGQAGYLLDDGETQIVIDPFCGEAKDGTTRNYPPTVEKGSYHVDLALVSHAHWDHLDPLSICEYFCAKELIGPFSVIQSMNKSEYAGQVETTVICRNETVTRGKFTITSVYADHDGDSCGYVIEHEGKKLFHTGDTIMTSRVLLTFLDLKPDVLFTAINGRGGCLNMMESALLSRTSGAKVAIPMHYDMISNNTEDPELFKSPMSRIAPDTKCMIIERAKVYSLEEIMA